ncbi:uncharacterized protein LOC105223765 isoform X1 [Bactrocera dorsalis]|uniref:Uncharacterized protein LOC105223765 isoform X1 n=1 Tax=Bactrocera dorsalis TaxID=27457 RepID=A0ABM3JDR0_BACDO|nr:uncharacterized protein LOC105223765 isoform X1 [Bactrocera dorsalis]XP_049307353.1 uncharacterized protein LOC105223765 isoform X1 [Bactrocera dorsalis]
MSIQSFDILLEKVRPKLTKQRKAIRAEQRLVLTLRFLATGHSFRDLAFAFRMGRSTVSLIISETCEIIWKELLAEYMPIPTTDRLKTVINDYYRRWKFPNCFGSIDGKHCQIKCPANSGSHYFNYLHYFSVVLQGVADADKKFVTIEMGGRGKQSDDGTFSGSTLFRLLEADTLNVPLPQALPNSNTILPNFLIGDEAYPLKTYLLRPFPRRNLNAKTENFNYRLSIARKCIECAFGILTSKWRFLQKAIETTPRTAIILIKCACVLHNFVRERDGDSDLDYLQTTTINNANAQTNTVDREQQQNFSRSRQTALNIRNELTEYLWEFGH